VVVWTYDFKIHAVAHEPPAGSSDPPLRSLDQSFQSLMVARVCDFPILEAPSVLSSGANDRY